MIWEEERQKLERGEGNSKTSLVKIDDTFGEGIIAMTDLPAGTPLFLVKMKPYIFRIR